MCMAVAGLEALVALPVEGDGDGKTMRTPWCLQLSFKMHSLVVAQGIGLACVGCVHRVVFSETLSKN